MKYIVKISSKCWLADWEGDPGRTIVESNAKVFNDLADAHKAKEEVAKEYSWRRLKPVVVEVSND
jgi:hypothetical protein